MNTNTELYMSSSKFSNTVQDPMDLIKSEVGRLLHAAIINKPFCERLLKNPMRSIEAGYCGETFHFPREFMARIKFIQAGCLEDFASQILQIMNSAYLPEISVFHYQ